MAEGEGGKWRPVIVVSREDLNRGAYILAVPLTSKHFDARKGLPNCVPFRAGEYGLRRDCVAQAEATTALPLDDIDIEPGPMAVVDEATLRDLIRAIGHAIGAECEPTP